jgi:hypothetical protein
MKTRYRRLGLLAALLLATVPVACGGDAADQQAEVDRELDLALANADSATLEDMKQKIDEQMAERQDQPETPAAAETPAPKPRPATTPASKPAAPQYEQLTAATGTSFNVRLDQELSTRNSAAGDLFTVTTLAPLMDGGKVVVPAGTKIRGEVTVARASGNSGENAELRVRFDDLTVEGQSYPVALTITQAANVVTKGRDDTGDKALKIGGGAAAGALVGQLIGKNTTATLIGAAVGAAAGTGLQMTQEDVDAYIPEGSEMTVRLDEPLTVRKKIG